MNAEAVSCFGPGGHLVGIRCMPEGPHAAVAFVMLNAGVISRIGPRRFNVKLARLLAGLGFASLRFDLSGQGDSRPAPSPAPHEKQLRADLQAAMDHFTATTGVRQFVVAGICSGANAGFEIAQHDPRVVGLWMLDGHAYPTFKSRLMRYRLQLSRNPALTLEGWALRAMRALFGRTRPSRAAGATAPSGGDMRAHAPTPAQYAAALQSLVGRGVRVFLMYSSDVLWHYSYAGQFRDTFRHQPFVNQVRCDHLADVDHTLTTLSAQADVMERIAQWAEAHWGTTRS